MNIIKLGMSILLLLLFFLVYNYLHEKDKLVLEAKVIKIYDGDTFLVNITNYSLIKKVRLKGIDFPDLHPEYRVKKWYRMGIKNKTLYECYYKGIKLLKNMLLNKTVIIIQDKKYETDKYNRLLGYVYYNGTDINRYLIEKGYAIPYYTNTYKGINPSKNGCLYKE